VFGSAGVGLAVHTVTATLLWWPIQWVLLDGRVGWRRLLPGALVILGMVLVVSAVTGAELTRRLEDSTPEQSGASAESGR